VVLVISGTDVTTSPTAAWPDGLIMDGNVMSPPAT
jgi:hypothetical protein